MSWLRKGKWEVGMSDTDGEHQSQWFDDYFEAIHCMKTHKDILKIGKFKIEGNIIKDRYFIAKSQNGNLTVTYGLRDWRD